MRDPSTTGKLKCPICSEATEVYDTRRASDMILRRRRCTNNHRFVSREVIVREVGPHLDESKSVSLR